MSILVDCTTCIVICSGILLCNKGVVASFVDCLHDPSSCDEARSAATCCILCYMSGFC